MNEVLTQIVSKVARPYPPLSAVCTFPRIPQLKVSAGPILNSDAAKILNRFHRQLYPLRLCTTPITAPELGQNKGIDHVSNYYKYLSINHTQIYETFASMDAATRRGLPDQLLHDLVDRFLIGKRDFIVANGVTKALKLVNRFSYFEMLQRRREYLEMLNDIIDEYQARGFRLSPAQQARYLWFTFFRDTSLVTKWLKKEELVYPDFEKNTWQSILDTIGDQDGTSQDSIRAVLLFHAFRHSRPQNEIVDLASCHKPSLDLAKVVAKECVDEKFALSVLLEWLSQLDVVDIHLVNAVLGRCGPKEVEDAVMAMIPDSLPDFDNDELYPVQLQYTFEDTVLYSELVGLASDQFALVATDKTYRIWLQSLLAQHRSFDAIEAVLAKMRNSGVVPSTKTWLSLFRYNGWTIEEYNYLVEYLVSLHNQIIARRLDSNYLDAFDSNGVSPDLLNMISESCSYPLDHLPLCRAKIIKLTDELLDAIIDGYLELYKHKPVLRWFECRRDEMFKEITQFRGPLSRMYLEGSKQTQAHVDEIDELKKAWLLELSMGPVSD